MGANASTQASPAGSAGAAAAQCPVDHKTREIWLQQHRGTGEGAAPHPIPATSEETNKNSEASMLKQRPLSDDREISSIPRAFDPAAKTSDSERRTAPSPYASSTGSHQSPSNSESETGHDEATGNWIYPSERQFFEALVRKSNVPGSTASAKELATSVASVIPIHNAVNEKAWSEILTWESRAPSDDPGSKKCGGPRLYSFRGLGTESQFVSPRARLNGLMGYQLPFDRHDWVVERCGGKRIEYVIDFYQGKQSTAGPAGNGLTGPPGAGKLSFYLDVRPKLNSFEGWRMRFMRFWGL